MSTISSLSCTVETGTQALAQPAVQGALLPAANPSAVRTRRLHTRGQLNYREERGMISAEWALGMVAAVALVGAVIAAITSGPVHDALVSIITRVLDMLVGLIQ